MPKKTNKEKEEIKEKIEYIGLDFDNLPQNITEPFPIKFRATKNYEENKHKQYRFLSIKDVELLLSPTNRLSELEEKYSKASPVYTYLIPDEEENIIKHTTFLNMLKEVKIEEIEKIEEEQNQLNKKIPFKVKYPGNYLWQVYYSESSDRYFMIVPTEESDYSTFFYMLKKQLEKKKSGKIFVPISHVDYSNTYLKKSQFEDIENYLWLFTKDWPMIYEVYNKKEELSIQIVGETEVYEKIKTTYKVELLSAEESSKFYRLLKALFILQTEVPHYYNFETNIDKKGTLEFYFEDKKIEYDKLPDFIKEQCIEMDTKAEQLQLEVERLTKKLEELKTIGEELEAEYLAKEKQISTFLECKKSFFGKVKYFFKYNKKSKEKSIKKKIEKSKDIIKDEEIKEDTKISQSIPKKKNYTIEELIEKSKKCYDTECEMKSHVMDINAIKLKNKNLTKKIENSTAYIEEIDKHKKSIFEFWKYSNKDEVSALAEGEEEEINIKKKVSKVFDYKEDIRDLGEALDKLQRKKLSKEETDSIFLTTTNVLDTLNLVKTNKVIPQNIESSLKILKAEAKSEKQLSEKEDFDIFGGRDDGNKIKILANKKHREIPKDKFEILDITKNTKQLGYKLSLERALENIKTAMDKIKVTEDFPIYKAIVEEKLDGNMLNVFNINPEEEMKNILKQEGNKINLYKINLKRNCSAIAYTNIIFYDNKNKTLPIGMDISSKILFDVNKQELKLENKKNFRVIEELNEKGVEKIEVKTITVFEYNVVENEE